MKRTIIYILAAISVSFLVSSCTLWGDSWVDAKPVLEKRAIDATMKMPLIDAMYCEVMGYDYLDPIQTHDKLSKEAGYKAMLEDVSSKVSPVSSTQQMERTVRDVPDKPKSKSPKL